jgi:hypothetical protein
MNICLVVSSYKESFAPGTPFSVHLAASAKASSELQLLFMMTPDQDPEFALSLCLASARPETKNNPSVQISGKFALMISPPPSALTRLLDISKTLKVLDFL